MATNLLTPILNDLTRSVNFFNGRLLTGEDLTTERRASRAKLALLGQTVGDGVAFGLEVSASSASKILTPVLSVKRGLALSRNGVTLFLNQDVDISLVRPPGKVSSNSGSIFQDCSPTESGPYIAGAGVYLLTIGPATGTQGLAEVSGIGSSQAPCNSKYNTDGVQFRLIPIDLTLAELDDANHLRNLVAYKFFNPAGWTAFVSDPFGAATAGSGLIDQLRSSGMLTDCEVPLTTLFWTATGGLVFVDNWSVRRPVFPRGTLSSWAPITSYRLAAEGLAMFLQFQSQVSDMLQFGLGATPLTSVVATDYFRYLPAAAPIPTDGGGMPGLKVQQFLKGMTYRQPFFIEGAKLPFILRSWLGYVPIDLTSGELIWTYLVRQNIQAIDKATGTKPQQYVVLVSGHTPFEGKARFDLNRWDYANFI